MKYWAILFILSQCLCSCKPKADVEEAKANTPAVKATKPEAHLVFEGLVYPLNATKLRAPANTFRIGNWRSSSSWIKLEKVAKDGKKIKKGEVLGRFEFRGSDAKTRINRQLQSAQARKQNVKLAEQSQMRTMNKDLSYKKLNAKLSELDTRKEGLVSARELKKFKITSKLADFEAQAQKRRLRAYRASARADYAYQERTVTNAETMVERFNYYKNKFKVLAPHDGIVRHGYHRRRGRKIKKGDGMPSGMIFASVARDKTLAVKFYVPEHRLLLMRDKKVFKMSVPASGRQYDLRFVRMEAFPQELGFLKNDKELPNAREKVFVIHAEFVSPPKGLNAGVDVEVMPQ